MRNLRLLGLLVAICGGLALTYAAAQKKPNQRPTAVQESAANPRQAEQNKVVVRELFEDMFSQGRYERQGQVFANNCTVHFGGRTVPLQEAVAEGKGWRNAAPDLVMEINQISANGDLVTVAWTAKGTHTGQGHGLKPTGRRVNMRGRSTFLVKNGRIVEATNEEYRPELFRQLGVSKTQALMFFAGERLVAALDPIIPDRLYALLQ
ncbi:MAG TPA: ester cyclase [Candidatus Angelobacter sp.]